MNAYVDFRRRLMLADGGVYDNRALVLRKRKVVAAFKQKRCRGAYGGIGMQVADYSVGEGALNIAPAKAAEVARQGRVRH